MLSIRDKTPSAKVSLHHRLSSLLCGFLFATAVAAQPYYDRSQTNNELWPGTTYDASIPTFEQVLGHAPGEWIVSHAEILKYVNALAEAAPDRLKVVPYAKSWEGRELVYVVFANAANMARLDAIEESIHAVAEPDSDAGKGAAVDQAINDLPATVWLAYGVHGNEISSPDAALLTLYYLLAAQNSEAADTIRDNAIVFIDPTQNPDGRDRFVNNFRANYGIEPDPVRLAAERDEPWPGGRTNHYLFDLNRDWFILTQPETVGRIKALRQYLPLVFVDLHEMGGDSSYYFAPEAVPYNPHLAQDQRDNLEIFGKNNAQWFDSFGFDYFTREIYDAFYPGYGASWPAYYGGVSMTYEMASARGLVTYRSDGQKLWFRDGVQRHFVTSISTAQAAAENRQKLWRDFRSYRETAISEGASGDIDQYVLIPEGDGSKAHRLAHLLAFQGARVYQTAENGSACGEPAPAGSYVIPLAQPAKRFIRNLLDQNVPMENSFLDEQERRRSKQMGDQIYDVTAWSLPMMLDVKTRACKGTPVASNSRRLEPDNPDGIVPGTIDRIDAKVGYVTAWGTPAAARLLARALRAGLVAMSPDQDFTVAGLSMPRGSLVFKVDDNPNDLGTQLQELAETTGAHIRAIDTSWVTEGVNFGSRHTVRIEAPKIAMAWDAPTSSNSAGNTRFVIERQIGYPVTVLRTARLRIAELQRLDVLILPDSFGSYSRELGEMGVRALKAWVRQGGTLITFGSATGWASREGLLATRLETLANAPGDPGESEDGTAPGQIFAELEQYLDAIETPEAQPDSVAGVLARTTSDPDHWLSAGLPETLHVLLRGNEIYTPLTLDQGTNVLRFEGPDELLASGYIWEENRLQLAYKPYLMHARSGRGQTIAFVTDPTTRAYLDGLIPALAGALFRAPAHARPVRGK